MGRPLGARGRRCAGAAAGGREGFGAAARRDRQRDQGGVPRREGRRAGAAGERRRTRRRKGRHARGARYAAHRARAEGRRARRAACRIQGRPDPRDFEGARPRRAAAGGRHLQSDDVGVRCAAGVVRFSVVDQGDHRAGHRSVAASQEGAAVKTAGGGRACRPARLWRALSRRARLAVIARSPIPIPKTWN